LKRSTQKYFCIVILSLFSFACERTDKNYIDLWRIKKEIKWGMEYKEVSKILNEKFDLKLLSKDDLYDQKYYLYSGGNVIGIASKGWKFKFRNGAIEEINVLIENKTNDELQWNYYMLSKHFSKVAEYQAGLINDTWVYYRVDENQNKTIDTNIIMIKKDHTIFINIYSDKYNDDSFFIF